MNHSPPAVTHPDRHRSGPTLRLLRRGFVGVVAVLMSIWCLFPLWWALIGSVKPANSLYGAQLLPFLQFPPTLGNWEIEWQRFFWDIGFAHGLGNSLLVGLVAAGLSLALGLPAALGLVLHYRARRPLWPFVLLLLLPRVIPPVVLVGPYSLFMRQLHLADTWLALVIAHTTLALPLSSLLLASAVAEVPFDLLEAAQLDGQTWPGILRQVVMPLIWPAFLAAGTLAFALSWNEFLFAVSNNVTQTVTAPVTVAFLLSKDGPEMDIVGSHLVLVLLPPLLVVLMAQRYLVRGLTFGAVRDVGGRPG
jgi:ABC-type glycerol-3-phosphate transport system permease component